MSPFHGLESKQIKGRISTAAPQILAYLLQSLRPILHITCPDSMISYSKGSRGLFVPSRVIGIFTDTTISLSSRLRQCPDHYTIQVSGCIRDLSIWHSPVFLLNSCLDLFSAPNSRWDPLSRSYRVNLPSSLTVNHSSASVFSTQLRVSVYGTGTL